MDNDNIFKNLKNLEVPVDENGWQSIANDRRLKHKFSKGYRNFKVITSVAASTVLVGTIVIATIAYNRKNDDHTKIANTETAVTTATTPNDNPQAQTVAKKTQNDTHTSDNSALTQVISDGIQTPHETTYQIPVSDGDPVEVKPAIKSNNNISNSISSDNSTAAANIKPINNTHIEQPKVELKNISTQTDDSDELFPELRSDNSGSQESVDTEEQTFIIPSAFTPNGDGLNDEFYVHANFEPANYEIVIMNRGGNVVFKSNNINIGWDGKYDRKILPQGVYVYVIRYKDQNGKVQNKQGQVLLLP